MQACQSVRPLFYLLLMLCLPLQGFAQHWHHAPDAEAVSLAHMVAHDEHIPHHHDDDGTVHYDDSDESAEHAQEHGSTSQPAGFTQPQHAVYAAPLVTLAPPEPAIFVPEPIPDRPQRPPSAFLG